MTTPKSKATDTAAEDAPRTLAPGEILAPKTVIKAVKGEPLPNPPHGGSWSRDPDSGDLTLVEPPTPPAEPRTDSAPPVEASKE
jgi:hypothetical protein